MESLKCVLFQEMWWNGAYQMTQSWTVLNLKPWPAVPIHYAQILCKFNNPVKTASLSEHSSSGTPYQTLAIEIYSKNNLLLSRLLLILTLLN